MLEMRSFLAKLFHLYSEGKALTSDWSTKFYNGCLWKVLLSPITSNDRSFDCPIIHTYTILNAILFIDTSTMLDITMLIL